MSRMSYGMPYMGSKNTIAKQIVDSLPEAEHFYDLFGGGGAITDYALQSGKYKYVHYNELSTLIYNGFKMAIKGDFKNETRWISREEFFKLKDIDPYVAICYSFGNNLIRYMYNKDIEKYKKACHYVIFFNDWNLFKELCPEVFSYVYEKQQNISDRQQKRLYLSRYIVEALKLLNNTEIIQNNILYSKCIRKENRLTNIIQLERLNNVLQRLERLERYDNLFLSNLDYKDVELKNNSVIYCDIPYKGTEQYKKQEFDYAEFYNWALKQDNIYISEYNMPDSFKCIKEINKRTTYSASYNNIKTIEKIFIPRKDI